MIEYGIGPEIVRIAVVTGVVISVLFYERFHLTTGGAIVPGYLAIGLFNPLSVVSTFLAGILTYGLVHGVIVKRRIVYGRRLFELEVLIGLGFILVSTVAAGLLGELDPTWAGIAGIGFLVPGIIAHDMGRQGPRRTLFATGIVTLLLGVCVFLLSALFDLMPGAAGQVVELSSVIGFPAELLLLAVGVSVTAGTLLFQHRGLRSGGFITGALIGLVRSRWADLVFVLGVSVITWFLVTRVLMPRLMLCGRRKLSAMLMVGALVAWGAELALQGATEGEYSPMLGMTVAPLLVPALIAKDAERQGWTKTGWGVAMTTAAVFAVTNLAAAVALAGGLL